MTHVRTGPGEIYSTSSHEYVSVVQNCGMTVDEDSQWKRPTAVRLLSLALALFARHILDRIGGE